MASNSALKVPQSAMKGGRLIRKYPRLEEMVPAGLRSTSPCRVPLFPTATAALEPISAFELLDPELGVVMMAEL